MNLKNLVTFKSLSLADGRQFTGIMHTNIPTMINLWTHNLNICCHSGSLSSLKLLTLASAVDNVNNLKSEGVIYNIYMSQDTCIYPGMHLMCDTVPHLEQTSCLVKINI
jgi:hypothetical protein